MDPIPMELRDQGMTVQEPVFTARCIARGTSHQNDSTRYLGGGTQCVAMSTCASLYSSIIKRREKLNSLDIDTILEIGDRLYMLVRPQSQIYLLPDEDLPSEIRIDNYLVKLVDIHNSWIINEIGPRHIYDFNTTLKNLKNILQNTLFNDSHNDLKDCYLFTTEVKTVSFWKFQNEYFLFNSHAVDEFNVTVHNEHPNAAARLFACDSLECLIKLLFTNNGYKGSQYSLHKISIESVVDINNGGLVAFTDSELPQADLDDSCDRNLFEYSNRLSLESFCDRNLYELSSHLSLESLFHETLSCDSSIEPISILPIQNLNMQPIVVLERLNFQPRVVIERLNFQPRVVIERLPLHQLITFSSSTTFKNSMLKYDPKLNILHPAVVLDKIDFNVDNFQKLVKRGRPPKQRKEKNNNNNNAHLIAVKKFNKNNPNIGKAASQRYRENNPEIHRKSVHTYTLANPDIHRQAVRTYTDTHPEINRQSVQTYSQTHPEVNRAAVSRYNKTNRNLDVALRGSSCLIGHKSNEELNAVKPYSLKKTSLRSGDVFRCTFCRTCLFLEEKTRVQWCCGSGNYNIQSFEPMTENFYFQESFLKDSRSYNNLFAFSALGTTHGFQNFDSGISFVKIQGRIYHRVFDLEYSGSTNPIGLYIVDGERNRVASERNLNLTVIQSISHFLHTVNPFIDCFKRLNQETSQEAHIIFESTSRRTHGNILGDLPLGREVAAIISTENERYIPRCIAIWKVGAKKPHTVDIFHTLYESFQYPLLYPCGNAGWYPNKLDNKGAKLTQNKYIRCLLLSEPRFSQLGRLSEEWLVDMFCRIIEERLKFINSLQNQSSESAFRMAPHQEVVQTSRQIVEDETILGEGGVIAGRVYLPNTFTGGPRYMKTKYMDAMALVNRLGPPSFFLTITCNPKWEEIITSLALEFNEKRSPLLCARVFNLKLTELLRDIRSGMWFGKCQYLMYVIEFQKRGLPHAHICFRVEGGGPVQNSDIDKFVRADIPNPLEAEGRLRKLVLNHMIHGPCGPPHRTDLPCWDKEKKICIRYFPKNESPVTFSDNKGFINLRRDSKNVGTIKFHGRDVTVSDLWVVPYNAALLLKYDCHINLEVCTTHSVIKYLFKYMTKGPDESRVAVVPNEHKNNEIEQYVTKRYIGSCDAAWRVLEFDLTGREPNVKQLSVHLAGQQAIFFRPGMETEAVQRSTSDLITYFNRPNGDNFDQMTYLDFFENYIVHASRPNTKNVQIYELNNKRFITKRQRGELVTRLFWVAPNRGEQFYLRLLLNSFPCRSYDDLYHLGGPNCKTFQEAAKAVGIANDELEYETAMEEASTFLTGARLRSFFVLLAVNGIPVASIWEKFKIQISEDIIHRLSNDVEKAFSLCLIQIDRLLRKHGTNLIEQGLPDIRDDSTELGRERLEYNNAQLKDYLANWLPQLSHDQLEVFEYVSRLLNDNDFCQSSLCGLFIDGPAGTGKTLLLNVLTAHVRANNGIVLCTASSGIAAQNYQGGTTAHTMFRFPIDLVDDLGYWNITNGSQRAELISNCNLIIYDEAPMAHKFLIHLLDRSLRDLMKSNKIFGGKIIVFAGDFRQIPPVVTNAKTNSDIFNCSVKSSPLWEKLKTFSLVTSQRCNLDTQFADFLLKLGSNQLSLHEVLVGKRVQNFVNISLINHVITVRDLIDFVFPFDVMCDPDECARRAILSTHNASVREINQVVLNKIGGDLLHFCSVDQILSDSADEIFFGVDMLNKLQPNGVPDHDLILAVGCVCMVMRNLSFSDRLVNGTKVIVVATSPRLITVRKPGESELYFIPRILFKCPIDHGSPYEMCRRQFPLQICYAMTIHKSQGQTINRVGVDLRSDVFSHGQLYVALGRVRDRDNIKILINTDNIINDELYVNNVVIPELL